MELIEGGLVDRVLAVTAMLTSLPSVVRGALGSRSHVSWRRAAALVAGGTAAAVAAVGLLALKAQVIPEESLATPTWLGGTLAFFGGMLGVATILAPRGSAGMSEGQAIRAATQAIAMTTYVAAPALTLAALGLTRLLRSCLRWTVVRARWTGAAEGVVLLLLCTVPRTPELGGLVMSWPVPGNGPPEAGGPAADGGH